MTDITLTNVAAAVIDQVMSGRFRGKPYAFISAYDHGWIIAVAVANEPGYYRIHGKTFETEEQADAWANGLNDHIGLSRLTVVAIISSTMGGSPIANDRNKF